MRTIGLPVITCERNVEMSHFGIHFSPFFYLLLPFYMMIPRPETIIVLQALGVISGFVPVILICRHFNFSKKLSLACAGIYMIFPTLIMPTLTDFHENKFLSVLLLWCIYFMLKKRFGLFLLFAVLTLTVKEDAAIYIMAIAAYLFFAEKKRFWGILTFLISSAYFAFASFMVSVLGDGTMTDRLANFTTSSDSALIEVLKTCFFNLGYAISQIFTAEKVPYIITVMLPLSFAPLFVKKKSALLLLLPMLVINLMPNWKYQYNFAYQYGYGSSVLAIFLFLIFLSESDSFKRRKTTLFSVMIAIVMLFSSFVPSANGYIGYSLQENIREYSAVRTEFISTLPKDAEYTASAVFVPHMYDFKTVYSYPDYYKESQYTEYLLASPSAVRDNTRGLADFIGDKYQLVREAKGIALYKLEK